jgi:hypothetical protein
MVLSLRNWLVSSYNSVLEISNLLHKNESVTQFYLGKSQVPHYCLQVS